MIDERTVLRLRVLAEQDAGVLLRVVERFANLNVIPLRLSAVCDMDDTIGIEVDIEGIPFDALAVIVAKLGESPSVFEAILETLG